MKLFQLKLVRDIFTSHIRYSKVALKRLFLLHFDKNCKKQSTNITKLSRMIWSRRALMGAYTLSVKKMSV